MTEPNRAVQEEELEALRAIFEVSWTSTIPLHVLLDLSPDSADPP